MVRKHVLHKKDLCDAVLKILEKQMQHFFRKTCFLH